MGTAIREKGIENEKVLAAVRKLIGHRPSNDVRRTNYAKVGNQELWKYYKELYYDLSVLTEEQKRMLGLIKEVKNKAHTAKNLSLKTIPTHIGTTYKQSALQRNTVPECWFSRECH